MYLWEQITHYQCDGENRVIFSRILDHQLSWHMFIIKRLLTNQCHPKGQRQKSYTRQWMNDMCPEGSLYCQEQGNCEPWLLCFHTDRNSWLVLRYKK